MHLPAICICRLSLLHKPTGPFYWRFRGLSIRSLLWCRDIFMTFKPKNVCSIPWRIGEQKLSQTSGKPDTGFACNLITHSSWYLKKSTAEVSSRFPPQRMRLDPSVGSKLYSLWLQEMLQKTACFFPLLSNMGVSKNRGTPKWMIYNGNPYYIKWMILGVPPFSETPIHIYIYIYISSYFFVWQDPKKKLLIAEVTLLPPEM